MPVYKSQLKAQVGQACFDHSDWTLTYEYCEASRQSIQRAEFTFLEWLSIRSMVRNGFLYMKSDLKAHCLPQAARTKLVGWFRWVGDGELRARFTNAASGGGGWTARGCAGKAPVRIFKLKWCREIASCVRERAATTFPSSNRRWWHFARTYA